MMECVHTGAEEQGHITGNDESYMKFGLGHISSTRKVAGGEAEVGTNVRFSRHTGSS